MKPELINSAIFDNTNANANELLLIKNLDSRIVGTAGIKVSDITAAIESAGVATEHIANKNIHITSDEKSVISNITSIVTTHTSNDTIHVTAEDKTRWNNKITTDDVQTLVSTVRDAVTEHTNNSTIHVTTIEKNTWSDKYAKSEVDNLIAGVMSQSYYKPSVATFADLATEYPDATIGWMATVEADSYTYRYNGVEWKPFTNDTVPMATQTIDGKMSKEDKVKIDGIEAGANKYVHPSGDSYNHVTTNQIEYWNQKAADSIVTKSLRGLMSNTDKIKLDGIESGANNYTHPSKHDANMINESITRRFCSDVEKQSWNNKASSIVASTTVNGLMSNTDKAKLDSIDDNANNYTHPEHHSIDILVESDNYKLVTPTEKTSWNSKETTTGAQTKADTALASAKAYIDSKLADLPGYTSDSSYTKVTLATSKWTTYTDHYDYTVTLVSQAISDQVTIGVDLTATEAQLSAIKSSNLTIANVANNTVITVRATILPTVDLPIILVFGAGITQA